MALTDFKSEDLKDRVEAVRDEYIAFSSCDSAGFE